MARPSDRYWTRESAVLACLAALALGACGGVSANSDDDGDDGSPGAESDAGPGPGTDTDGSPDGGSEPTPDAEPPPSQCEDGVTPLLTNAGFEEAKAPPVGAIGWIEDPSPATYPDDQIPVNVPEGNRAALLGSELPMDVRLTQQSIVIPEATESLRLSYTKCIETDEEPGMVFDTLEVLLLDEAGDVVETFTDYDNLDARVCPTAADWDEETFDLGSAHAGEELQFQFHGVFDNGTQTSFYFDAVALDALGPCPE